ADADRTRPLHPPGNRRASAEAGRVADADVRHVGGELAREREVLPQEAQPEEEALAVDPDALEHHLVVEVRGVAGGTRASPSGCPGAIGRVAQAVPVVRRGHARGRAAAVRRSGVVPGRAVHRVAARLNAVRELIPQGIALAPSVAAWSWIDDLAIADDP